MKKIGVIGGGPSGIMAAIEAANKGALVTLFERKDRIGKKILVTGNGRCNFTNELMSKDFYYSEDDTFVESVLNEFNNKDLINYFSGLGLLIHERNGYYYPFSDQASSVLDILRYTLREKGVKVLTDSFITRIEKANDEFYLWDSDNKKYSFDAVIVSTGGKAGIGKKEEANGYDLLKPLGIKISKLFPALTQIKCEGINFKALSGVKSEAHIYLFSDEELMMEQHGELLFNENGISGIVSFQISHGVSIVLQKRKTATLVCDLIPGLSSDELTNFVKIKSLLNQDLTLEEFFTGFSNKKINIEVIKLSGLKPSAKISDIDLDALIDSVLQLKEIAFTATGVNDFDSAQVTAGGVLTSEVSKNLECKNVKDLYVTGELLDVDGICGGYNLQWAFSTGYIAGNAAAGN